MREGIRSIPTKKWHIMKIRKVHLQNFRCYESKDFQFNENLTVVVGSNTSGKTSLLRAIRIGLGGYLSSLPTLDSGSYFRCNFTKEDRRQWFNERNHDYEESEIQPCIKVEGLFPFPTDRGDGLLYEERPIKWYREMTKANNTVHNRKCAGELIDAAGELVRRRRDTTQGAVFPLILSFSADRMNAQGRQSGKVKERLKRIDKAYRSALRNDIDFNSAIDWLKQYDKNMEDRMVFAGNKEAFFEAISKAIPMLSQVTLHSGQIEAVVEINGVRERHHYNYMSDGFKSVICLVSEIAYRAIMLNGFLGAEAVYQTPGIVLIDELDLFLHPLWQRRILGDLQSAFPNIQFIATTHSPFIIQSVSKEQLLVLDDVEVSDEEPNMKSIEDIAEEEMNMGAQIRSKEYMEMLNAAQEFFEVVTHAKDKTPQEVEELRLRLAHLQARVGNDPVYRALMEEKMDAHGLL